MIVMPCAQNASSGFALLTYLYETLDRL